MFKFITHRPFWVNLIVIILFSIFFVWGFLQLLGVITKHGEYLTVPSVTHKTTEEAVKILESKGFDVVIQDSVYVDTAKMGTVLKQFPEPNSTVKVNRVVLLTINRSTLPLVDMPMLQGKSLGYALEILRRSHLLVGDTTYKPDFMMGSVLEQSYNGTVIGSGAKVPWGSKIDMVIGGGLANDEILVPSLLGLTYGEAKLVLEQNGIMLASTVVDPGVADTANAFVYKQIPPKLTEDRRVIYIRPGQLMDVYLSLVPHVLTDSTTENP